MDKENQDIDERIRLLREERARKQAEIERLRAENERMAQQTRRWEEMAERLAAEVERFTQERLSGPSGPKKN